MPTSRLLAIPLLLASAAGAVVITKAPGKFVLDGSISEWLGQTADFRSDGGSSIWLAQTSAGLVIAGSVNRTFPFAKTPDELASGGALEIALTLVDTVDFPDLPYEPGDCAMARDARTKSACLAWFERQKAYREYLTRQFSRLWRIAPVGAREVYAAPADELITGAERAQLRFPPPEGLPTFRFRESPLQVTFEVLIPWEILPPADRLNLDRLHVKITLSTRVSLPWSGEPEDLPLATVFPPISTRITTCGQPLLASDSYGNEVQAFYFPAASLQIDKTFSFADAPIARRDSIPPVDEISPTAVYRIFDIRELEPGEFLCGPFLSYRKGSTVRHYPFVLADIHRIAVKPRPDGLRLLIHGPVVQDRIGATRGYSVIDLEIYSLDPDLLVKEALNLHFDYDDTGGGFEIEIAPDLTTVKEFRQAAAGSWISETFCLSGTTYFSCAKETKSTPPAKRVLTPDIQ